MKDKIVQIQEGLAVQTADGNSVGTITRIWWGSIPTDQFTVADDETCFEIQHCALAQGCTLYVPCSVVADVTSDGVTLTLNAEAVKAKAWKQKPKWLPADPDVRPFTSYREASA